MRAEDMDAATVAELHRRICWIAFADGGTGRREITYPWWDAGDVAEFFDHWGDLDGWIVAFSDHVLASAWEFSALREGRYAFPPLPWVSPGSRFRKAGDGPANWTCSINVSRPKAKRFMGWGSLPGAYVVTQDRGARIGGKPLALMRALVRDYSAPADRVCDPCAGYGTTMIAALIEGRRAIGCEIDPEAFDVAVDRLRAGYTPATLWAPDRVPADQTELDL